MALLSRATATTVVARTAPGAAPDNAAPAVRVTTLAASFLAAPAALAVNYDDYVRKAVVESSPDSSFQLPSIDLPSLPSVELPSLDFLTENPLVLVLGLAAVAVPFIASRAFAGPGAAFGAASAGEAFESLSSPDVQLLDIRAAEDVKAEGSPSLKSIKKSVVRVAYAKEDDAFVDKVLAKCKNAENTTLYILDRFDGSAANVAKLLANSGFKGAYAIRGGAEGPNGWQAKGLPWAEPAKSFTLDISGLKNIIKGDGQGISEDALPTTIGVAVAAVAGAVVLSETETTLQLLGTVALAQLFIKKFLFAEERKKTVAEIKSFLDTKIAPKEFVQELKEVGRAILPSGGEVKAAVVTGEKVLEKELGVDSVTPESLAEKAKEKLGEEAEKLGLELPEEVKSAAKEVKSAAEAAPEEVKSAAKDVKSAAEAATEEVKSAAKDVKSAAEAATEEVKSAAEEVESSNGAAAEEEAPATLPGLQEPPALPPKAEAEEEAEPTPAAPAKKEVKPFFESDLAKVSADA